MIMGLMELESTSMKKVMHSIHTLAAQCGINLRLDEFSSCVQTVAEEVALSLVIRELLVLEYGVLLNTWEEKWPEYETTWLTKHTKEYQIGVSTGEWMRRLKQIEVNDIPYVEYNKALFHVQVHMIPSGFTKKFEDLFKERWIDITCYKKFSPEKCRLQCLDKEVVVYDQNIWNASNPIQVLLPMMVRDWSRRFGSCRKEFLEKY